jgi:hypothetical protein
MSNSAERIIIVPAELVEALRTGLYIEESAATEELRRNPLQAGEQPDPDRFERVENARELLECIGRERPDTPVAVRVSLRKHRWPLLAALCGKMEADARALGRPGTTRYPPVRNGALARLNALAEFMSTIQRSGGPRDDAGRHPEEQLHVQLERALTALGYDENRGDWWRVTYDGGVDGWGIKGAVDGKDVDFDVTVNGYTLS